MTLGPRTFAPFLAGILGSLAHHRLYGRTRVYVARGASPRLLGTGLCPGATGAGLCGGPCCACVAWIVAAQFWAPETKRFAHRSDDLLDGSFSMDMPGIRFGLTALAGLWCDSRDPVQLRRGPAASVSGVIVAVALVQFVGVVFTALFTPQILDAAGAGQRSGAGNAAKPDPQCQCLHASIAVPAGLGLAPEPPAITGGWAAVALLALITFCGVRPDRHADRTDRHGVHADLHQHRDQTLAPKNGFRILFSSLAVYVTLAPASARMGRGAAPRASVCRCRNRSFSRTYSWELVRDKVSDSPFIGHGLEASYTWTDTYGDHPEWLADAVARYQQPTLPLPGKSIPWCQVIRTICRFRSGPRPA